MNHWTDLSQILNLDSLQVDDTFVKNLSFKFDKDPLKVKLLKQLVKKRWVKSSDFSHFAAHNFIWQLWPEKESYRGDPYGVTGFGIFKIRPGGAELQLFEVCRTIRNSETWLNG